MASSVIAVNSSASLGETSIAFHMTGKLDNSPQTTPSVAAILVIQQSQGLIAEKGCVGRSGFPFLCSIKSNDKTGATRYTEPDNPRVNQILLAKGRSTSTHYAIPN